MELELRILVDCINRLLDSLNRLTTLLVTVALMAASRRYYVKTYWIATNVNSIGIYSYHIPLLVAYFVLCGLAYLRMDILTNSVLLRQVIAEQEAFGRFVEHHHPVPPVAL